MAALAGATVVAGAAALAGRRRRQRAAAPVADRDPRAAGVLDDRPPGVAEVVDGHRTPVPVALAGDPPATDEPATDPPADDAPATDVAVDRGPAPLDSGPAPVDEEIAAWAGAVTGRGSGATSVRAAGSDGLDGGADGALSGEAVLRLAADTTPIGDLSVADVAEAVRHAWSAEGNGRDAGPGAAGASLGHGVPAAEAAPPRPAGGPALPRRLEEPAAPTGRRPWALVGAVVALALAVVLGVGVAGLGDGGSSGGEVETATPSDDDPVPPSQATTVPTTVPAPLTAAEAFPATADRLNAAGSFNYAGTVSATDVSHVRPMLWLSVESTVEGQVALAAGRSREVAVAADGRAAETVTDGPRVLGRRADAREALAALPFELVPGLSGEGPPVRGAALLPTWLAGAVGPADAAPDEAGRRRFSATIPAAVFGPIVRERAPVDVTVLLTVDAAGTPARVEISAPPADDPPLRLVFDLTALGAPVDIQPPA